MLQPNSKGVSAPVESSTTASAAASPPPTRTPVAATSARRQGRHGFWPRGGHYGLDTELGNSAVWSGNVWDDDSQPMFATEKAGLDPVTPPVEIPPVETPPAETPPVEKSPPTENRPDPAAIGWWWRNRAAPGRSSPPPPPLRPWPTMVAGGGGESSKSVIANGGAATGVAKAAFKAPKAWVDGRWPSRHRLEGRRPPHLHLDRGRGGRPKAATRRLGVGSGTSSTTPASPTSP